MKVIFLAAGYGTRLDRDLRNDPTGEYTELIGVPKPLLPIGHQSVISRWATDLKHVPEIEGMYVVTNESNYEQFVKWRESYPEVELLNDGSATNETRIGAVADIDLVVNHFNITDDALVIAGDTLFFEDFNLQQYISKFEDYKRSDPEASMLVHVNCPDELVHKYGILETDSTGRVTGFVEKPQPHETTSRKQCPCFYFLNKKSLHLLGQFLDENKSGPLKSRDATGNFIAYLYKRKPVFTTEISGRFDVGGLDSYLECHNYFLNHPKS